MNTTVVNVYHGGHTRRIGRPTKWGNPYALSERSQAAEVACLLAYARYLRDAKLIDQVGELRGEVLGCYCAPRRCHGDILARCADAEDARAELHRVIEELEHEQAQLTDEGTP